MSDPNAALAACSSSAVKLLAAIGAGDRTYEAIQARTGLRRRSMFRARDELRRAGLLPEPDEAQRMALVAQRIPHLPPPRTRDPAWLRRLRPRLEQMTHHRSWRVLEDAYGPTWDELCHLPHIGVEQFVDLAVHYLELVDGAPTTAAERREVQALVISYGKAALWGIAEAVVAGSVEAGVRRMRYAKVVAARVARRTEAP